MPANEETPTRTPGPSINVVSLARDIALAAAADAERDREDEALHAREAELFPDLDHDGCVDVRSLCARQRRERDAAHLRGQTVVEYRLASVLAWRARVERVGGALDANLVSYTRALAADMARWVEPTFDQIDEVLAGMPELVVDSASLPTVDEGSRETARALVRAGETVAKAPLRKQGELLAWAARKAGTAAIRAGWNRDDVIDALLRFAPQLDEAYARRTIGDAL
ncbi:hypothetical protein IF188_08285 [Microbacterium sp. NEAU-LLC]|uniref:DUF222 domain-containing protein n=1 Tax=Microbacterium helvum TaxID=2773713 RepID=A0ABR8NLY8_9MICO|nr:hypothetical protein [Microbacterium helvum]MBD3941690.1 hypothetical protein [Microbacterium helvum]